MINFNTYINSLAQIPFFIRCAHDKIPNQANLPSLISLASSKAPDLPNNHVLVSGWGQYDSHHQRMLLSIMSLRGESTIVNLKDESFELRQDCLIHEEFQFRCGMSTAPKLLCAGNYPALMFDAHCLISLPVLSVNELRYSRLGQRKGYKV